MKVSFIIPAYNEARTVGDVVRIASSTGLGEVIVVSDGSRDGTGEVASAAGAQVITLDENRGKGAAISAALPRVQGEVVVLLDADLVGLRADHIEQLAGPVLRGEADMAVGVFSGGRFGTDFAQRVAPHLSGQRAVRRGLLDDLGELPHDYGVDLALSRRARSLGARVVRVPLRGISQVMKEEKYGLLGGLWKRARMYAQVLWYALRHRRRRSRTGGG